MSHSRPAFRAALALRRQLRFVDGRLATDELSDHKRKRMEREREAYAFALALIREHHPTEVENAEKYDDDVRARVAS